MLNLKQYDLIENNIKNNIENLLLKQYKIYYDFIIEYLQKTYETEYPIITLNKQELNNFNDLDFTTTIHCYCLNSLYHSYELINGLNNMCDKYNMYLVTIIPYKIFSISIDYKKLLVFHELPHDINIYKLIFSDKEKKIININLLLMNIYKKLYDISQVVDFKNNLAIEYDLFKTLTYNNISYIYQTPKLLEKISIIIFKDFICNNDNVILIGENAINILTNNNNNNNKLTYLLEIISEMRFKEIFSTITNLLIENNIDVKLFFTIENINELDDHKLKRLILYYNFNNIRINILHCYNITQYSLIPLNSKHIISNLNIANDFVILYFLLINIFIIDIKIHGSTQYSKEKMILKKKHIFNIFLKYRKHIINKDNIITLESKYYKGVYYDEVIEIKIYNKNSNKNYPKYIPSIYKEYNNEYKKINLSILS